MANSGFVAQFKVADNWTASNPVTQVDGVENKVTEERFASSSKMPLRHDHEHGGRCDTRYQCPLCHIAYTIH